MTYPYGMKGAPAAGKGLGGLPSRDNGSTSGSGLQGQVPVNTSAAPTSYLYVRSDQVVTIPDWVTYARINAVGKGGTGALYSSGPAGGGGGGFSGTNIELVSKGAQINVRFTASATTVEGLGYQLSAGNGGNGSFTTKGAGGIASGGAVNYAGGAGGAGTSSYGGGGGGAASRAGPGSAGQDGVAGTAGHGGAGGPRTNYPLGSWICGGASGGNGSADFGATYADGTIDPLNINIPAPILVMGTRNGVSGNYGDGGDGGGGGGGYPSGNALPGGAGLVLIEYW